MVETEEELKSLVDKGDRGEREKKKKRSLKTQHSPNKDHGL